MQRLLHYTALLTFLLVNTCQQLQAMPAYPKRIPIVIGADTVYIRLFGDEHAKRAETEEGYTLIQKNGTWYYAEKGTDGLLQASAFELSGKVDNDTKHFLERTTKHLAATYHHSGALSRSALAPTRSQNVQGIRKMLIILMEYADLSFVKTRDDFEQLFNGKNYSEDGAEGSVADFFKDVSYGQMQLRCDVVGPFKSKNKRSYYGGNNRDGRDNAPQELFKEAIEQVSTMLSLADYDADGDGYVDNIHIIFAGHGEEAGAGDDAIWSHEATFYQPIVVQNMKIDRYSCAPELRGRSGTGISRIGPHCHEIGHALGAMDYYDTNYEIGGEYEGTGQWDVMASGSWNNEGITPADFNPYVKAVDFGWIVPAVLPFGEIAIAPSYQSKENYYQLKSADSEEFYFFEYRSKELWGSALPGEGLLIFHVHPDIAKSGNSINANAPQMCYVVCASSGIDIPRNAPATYGNINTSGCPFPGSSHNTDFGQSSLPRAFFWGNEDCGIEINNISIGNDGLVYIENNSNGYNDDGQEWQSLFYEDFEQDDVQINVHDNGIFNAKWQVVKNADFPSKIIEKPLAYRGTKSLQLSAKKVSDSISCYFDFTFPTSAQESALRVKVFTNSLNPQDSIPNLLKIGYRTNENSNYNYCEIVSAENNLWKQSIIELPANIIPFIRVEGIAYSGSVLAVDNIVVEQRTADDETGVSVSLPEPETPTSVFSINGQKLFNMHKGINIVRYGNGSVRKILIK